MTAQLFVLFCFGLVVSFIVFLGIVRARDFKEREMAGRTFEPTDTPATAIAKEPPVSAKQFA